MNVERKYLARLADELLDRSLEASGAVLIEGASGVEKQVQQERRLQVLFICKTLIIEIHI
jgi:hypothetical protein